MVMGKKVNLSLWNGKFGSGAATEILQPIDDGSTRELLKQFSERYDDSLRKTEEHIVKEERKFGALPEFGEPGWEDLFEEKK